MKTQIRCKTELMHLERLLLLLALCVVGAPLPLRSQPALVTSSATVSAASAQSIEQNPHKAGSELNHHLAGYALIAIGLLVIAGQSSERLRSLRFVWPFLFVTAGTFLAVWSDVEMWPRGNLNWIWLIHHDAEARQHKIYAALLIVIGIVEYLRGTGRLGRFWRAWTFAVLALAGVTLLLFHDHSAGSGASSPEASTYVVSWLALDTRQAAASPMGPSDLSPAMHHHHKSAEASLAEGWHAPDAAQNAMLMDAEDHDHQHVMTPAMLKVEHQHLLFALIGIAVLLFKFIDDAALWCWSFVRYLWPVCITVLGLLLVLYSE